ncbi:MAG TPA: hypothetical protein VMZ50_00985, partial [Phycisphaerae bacterium]|nr:hypothetical protein [Phycisphaerae bacterium]
EDRDLIRRIARALKAGGRCLLEVYNKEFALQHGVERTLFYDESVDRFVAEASKSLLTGMKLYSREEWESMLGAHGLRITKRDGWNYQRDPNPPPWRADLIVAQKEPG